MKVGEFSRKYEVDPVWAHTISRKTPTRIERSWELEIPEEEMTEAALEALNNSIRFHQEKIRKHIATIARIKRKRKQTI